MIKSLRLDNYGKFRDAELAFGPFTVVYGPNEAGKTTVFDALFEAACAQAPRRGQVWKRLSDRYGDDRKARGTGQPPVFKDAVAFLELFAIRQGRISINAEKGGSWAEAAKNSLYSHGYNPAELAEKLEKRASASNATRHQKRLNALNAELDDTRARISGLRAQESSSATVKTALDKAEARVAVLEADIARLEPELAAARAGLEKFKNDLLLHRTMQDRDFTAGAIQREKNLAEVEHCRAEHIAEYDRLLERVAAAERGLAEAEGAAGGTRETIAKLEAETKSFAGSREEASRYGAAAAELLAEVNRLAALRGGVYPALSLPPGLRYGILAFGAAGLLAGLYLSRRTPFGYLLAAACAAGAFALYRYLYTPKAEPDAQADEKANLEIIYMKWAELGFDRTFIARPTIAGVQDALADLKGRAAGWDIAVENNKRDAQAAGEALRQIEARKAALAADKDACSEAAGKWLASSGCADRDEYMAKAARREALNEGRAAGELRLSAMLEAEKCSSCDSLLALLDSRVKGLEAGGAQPRAEAEKDVSAAEKKAAGLAAELRSAETELGVKKIERENLSVGFSRDMAKLPDAMNALRRREYDLKEEAGAEALARAGAAMAASVYRELETDSSRKFVLLARNVGAALAELLPRSELRIEALSLEGVAMRDEGGELRALENLSSGTRDCFMLAARLSMAAGARGKEPGLLLLDDPFTALDPMRRSLALNMLRRFQLDKGWQVVLFTKDKALMIEVEKDPQVTVLKLG